MYIKINKSFAILVVIAIVSSVLVAGANANSGKDNMMSTVKSQSNPLGLVLHWDFDAVTGNIISDISGHGNDGTSSAENPVLTPGVLGQAMTFDEDNDDRVRILMDDFPGEEFSFAVWVRSTDSSGGSTIVSYRNMDRTSSLFRLAGVNGLFVLINGQFVRPNFGTEANPEYIEVGDGQWHHLVINWTRINGELTIYKNGLEVFSATDVGRTKPISAIGEMNIGMDREVWTWSNAYAGDMDDVRLYSRTLSPDEISWLASATPLNDNQAPSAPANLQAVAVSQQKAYLSWDASVDNEFVAGYRVYRNNNLIGTTGESKFRDIGMSP
ncbi:hypothetical protein MNBD_GAMMA01-1208, partial [hydrothermal vent metagenome]